MYNTFRIKSVVCFVLALFFSMSVYSASVKDIRVAQQDGLTRLVFELDSEANHRLFLLSSPDRVVLDLESIGSLSSNVSKNLSKLSSDMMRRLRYAKRDQGARFVIDLNGKVKAKSSVLSKNAKYGPRILVELEYGKKKPVKVIKSVSTIENAKRDIVVVIDPGHGGKDPGALGKYKVREKDVVLSIGKELAKRINQVKGFKAVLTRSTDVYLKLRQRTKVAREANADILISIHADAFTKSSARGASVWALSLGGKTSEMGRWLAQQEQSSDLVGGISLDDKDQLLAEVLLDMSMNSTIQMSLDIGESVLAKMTRVAKLHKNTVQQAGFVVLKSPDIPSLLIETGFVSNPTEAKNLSSRTYRKKLAQAISKGVIDSFSSNPPEGTYLAWKQKRKVGHTYTVSKGDTLSEIARRNQVSLKALRAANTLKNDVIWIGQKLKIPAS
ncbi:N-acetylmuramoyl-L-alanine amidase [Marinomonas mediterranea]|jgi:N-acetylmuramoyl-L-alanine amidase|uniref:N-acetylmuramoyl-L-alanine amidase AmiC n=1 Tax=Marinomonas mediterranea (strain ATCC 700492 / JCM 21426 / NBRC 103028 / MMB-1) TaxID=717774 RepID=F2JWL9_MARM1|nr:N-acetylmuramoyl-L-alanine amidase [Marinomonas mediterranea]ADZ91783.1 cell wall hydrolase/autolysin [Marinomonas mediterranea MMB-1]WCN17876.1 LysM peptidoglycan-binding domain-containing protein [Marinomonas mediterranea MMB-1]